jgi:urate oxidase
MKRVKSDPDMVEEYDFTGAVRGEYAKRYTEGTNVVVIDPDVAKYFPDHESVNEALRSLTKIIKRQRKPEQRQGAGRS